MLDKVAIEDFAAELLTPRSSQATVLFGAGGSSPSPSDLPHAVSWKQMLLAALNNTSGLSLSTDDIQRLSESSLKLEAVLQACDDAADNLGRDLARAVDLAPGPNDLHRLVAGALLAGSISSIITTNWDCLLETALGWDPKDPLVWTIGRPWNGSAKLYKLHGSTAYPDSLRHTFRTINQPFPTDVRTGLAVVGSGMLFALGYRGADHDVITPLVRGNEVFWLQRSPITTLDKGPDTLQASRRVYVAVSDFKSLVQATGGCYSGQPNDGQGLPIRAETHRRIESVGKPGALEVLDVVLYRTAVAEVGLRDLDAQLMLFLRSSNVLLEDRLLQARAARAQFYGGGLALGPGKAAWLFFRSARLVRGPERLRRLSDAADVAELLGYGLIPRWRALFARVHRSAANAFPQGGIRAVLEFRHGRSLASAGRWAESERVFSRALAMTEGDMSVEGNLRKRRALSRAYLGKPSWRADIDAARTLHEFEQRSAELADLLRTEAACSFIFHGDRHGARIVALKSYRLHRERGQKRGALRSRLLAEALRLPAFVGRLSLRFLYG